MRITDINIHKFGAIENFALEAAPITVIYGNNESGKTTILDALLDALFNVSARDVKEQFSGIDRYEEGNYLDGNVCIERRGVTLTYPSSTGDTLDTLAGFPPIYIRNLLVVRESDLQFYDRQSTWWSDLKDHLCGFEGGLDAIRHTIHEEVGLDSNGEWLNEKGRRISDEVKNLRETAQRLKNIQDDVEELAQLRSRLRRISLKREVTEKHIELMKRAREKEQLETALVLKRKLEEERQHVAELSKYEEEAHATWRRLETEIEATRESLTGLSEQKTTTIAHINETESEASRLEQNSREWARRESEITPQVETGLHEISEMYEKERRLLTCQNFLIGGSVLLSAMTLLFIVFAVFKDIVYVLPTLTCAGGAAVCAGIWLFRRKLSRRLAVAKQSILEQFHSFGEQASSVDEIETWISTARKSSEQSRGAAESLAREAERERKDLERLDLSLQDKREHLKRLESEVQTIRNESICRTIDEFEAKMAERVHAEDEVKSLHDKINMLLGCTGEDEWEEKLDRIDEYQDVEILWDEDTMAQLEKDLPGLAEEENIIREKTVAIEKMLLEVGCNSPEDAWQLEEDVTRRLIAYELDRRAAETALSVIEGLSEHQDTIINTVLESGGDSATYYFRQVTADRYNNIFWQDGELFVQTPNGNTFGVESLSTGTMAQLQFSLRVSLLQRLFGGDSLFLLLDDPFLTSDMERTKELLETLVDFSHRGWQIIYFTVDEEVPEIFKELDPENVLVKSLPRLNV